MQIFNNLKMKYRLMLICSIPLFILMIFILDVLKSDYNSINEMNDDIEIIKIFEDSRSFLNAISNENVASVLYLRGFDGGKEDLQMIREETDLNYSQLKNTLEKSHLKIKGSSINHAFDEIKSNIDTLLQKRSFIDSKQISLEDLDKLFANLRLPFIEELTGLSRVIYELEVAQTFFANLYVYLEEQETKNEWKILAQAAAVGEMSEQDLSSLNYSIGMQDGLKKAFFTLAKEDQDKFYSQTMRGQAVANASSIREIFLNSKKIENKKIDIKHLSDIFKNKVALFAKIQQKLNEETINYIHIVKSNKIWQLILIITSIAVTLPISIFLMLYSLKGVVKKLQEEIITLSKSGQEIMESINEASSGTEETATSVTETTTTVEELKQTAQVAAEKAKNVADVSNDAIIVLREGEKSLEETINGMLRIQSGMTTISESIIKLSEHSQSIGEIIETVNELAEQSHLLAVNAAIEAAKAGDQGKGFSVVAQEVRSLAEQSKQATVQVKSILNDIQNSTSAAVMATEQGSKAVQNGMDNSSQVNESIRSLSEGVSRVVDASAQIALSSEQQLIGVNQVNIAMSNIKTAAQQHVNHIRQIEKAIQGMNAVGNSLKELVIKF